MKKKALLLMIITLLSKTLGFVREIILSYFYGASNVSDAYFISLTIPVVIFSFIGVGITTGYIPMYSKIEIEEGTHESYRFTSNLISILIIISTLVILVVQLFTESIVRIFASGFEGDTLLLATNFTRITVFGIYFTGIITILNGFLQIKDKFVIPAILGFIYNICIIASIYFSYKTDMIILSIGSVIALLVQFIFLLYFVLKEKMTLRFIASFKNKHIKSLGKIALPLIFGISISQINVLVDKTLASRIAIGGISALNYADRLNSFILSTVVMSISVAIYPMMSKTVADKKNDDFKKIISESIITISILLVPSTVGAIFFAVPLVRLLFARGAFDSKAITLTSSALLFYSLGMLGIGLREVLSRAFYSMQETKTPVKNAAVGMILNIILNIILSRYIGIGGLALATSISATFTTVMLFISLRKKIGPFGMKQISISFLKILLASSLMGLFAKLSFNYLTTNFSQNISILIAIGVGVVSYFVIIYFMKIEDVDVIVGAIKKKFGRGTA
ncbi:murein biosynthesis integral membrane protein MurJ [Crassaminicella thermophila]|uniref:Probable lipid II flippase MurJ n=1 Tax=Crassaminicella thermophila TaxID=2599308 RepID=A0A5C0SGU8_CRATE|nr:murein biosynthesis integral membrane protein MurJ [Crassaminicella thermophila]QEK13192.1 murein biosynthesis integral membrane protein MurJ [Crassaminicella thermophila]